MNRNTESNKPFKPLYHIFSGTDSVLDEKGNQYLSLRKVQWGNSEPDESKAKLELRRWMTTAEGETPLKGVVFNSPEGVNEVVMAFIELGYGKTTDILRAIRKRHNFVESVKESFSEDEVSSDPNGEYFDMRKMLLGEE